MGLVATFSGPIGSDRSRVAVLVAEARGCACVKFSEFIKADVERAGGDPTERVLMQRRGQQLVQEQLTEFVQGVLEIAKTRGWTPGGELVVDGLRHAEVLVKLRELVPSKVLHISISADPLKREEGARQRGIQERFLYRYDSDLTELQNSRILPAYADLELDGSDPPTFMVEKVVARFNANAAVG